MCRLGVSVQNGIDRFNDNILKDRKRCDNRKTNKKRTEEKQFFDPVEIHSSILHAVFRRTHAFD
jgi:hypothetical protein